MHSPLLDQNLGLLQRVEELPVEQFIPQQGGDLLAEV